MGAGCFCVGSPLGRRRLTVLSCASTAPRVQAGIYLHVNDVNASTHDTTVEWSVPCTTVYIYYIYEVRIIYMYSICIAPRVRPVRRHMGIVAPPWLPRAPHSARHVSDSEPQPPNDPTCRGPCRAPLRLGACGLRTAASCLAPLCAMTHELCATRPLRSRLQFSRDSNSRKVRPRCRCI